MKHVVITSVRLEVVELEDIEKFINEENNPYSNYSEAMREGIKIAMYVHRTKEMMQNPAKRAEFEKQLMDMTENKKLEDMMQAADDQTLSMIIQKANTERNSRYEQRNLV